MFRRVDLGSVHGGPAYGPRGTGPGAAGATVDPMPQTADDYSTVLSASEGVLDDVERALTRLDQGTYGVCEACGQPIDEDRLASFPTARTCAGHPQLTDPD